MPSQFVSVFVPLILIVVIETSSVLREMELTGSPSNRLLNQIPGKFYFLHIFNVLLMTYILDIMSSLPTQDILKNSGLFVFSFALMLLPFFETTVYDDGIEPHFGAITVHTIIVFILMQTIQHSNWIWSRIAAGLLVLGLSPSQAITLSTISTAVLPVAGSLVTGIVFPLALAKSLQQE